MIKMLNYIFVLVFFLTSLISSAQEQDENANSTNDLLFELPSNRLDSIMEKAKEYLNVKYTYGGCSENGFDCSGFIYYVFNQFNIQLSRSSSRLSNMGKDVEFKDVRVGDLLFFKSRDLESNHVGHVSLVISKSKSSFQMIHATRRGVVIDSYDEIPYYQKRYLFAKRIVSLNETCHL